MEKWLAAVSASGYQVGLMVAYAPPGKSPRTRVYVDAPLLAQLLEFEVASRIARAPIEDAPKRRTQRMAMMEIYDALPPALQSLETHNLFCEYAEVRARRRYPVIQTQSAKRLAADWARFSAEELNRALRQSILYEYQSVNPKRDLSAGSPQAPPPVVLGAGQEPEEAHPRAR